MYGEPGRSQSWAGTSALENPTFLENRETPAVDAAPFFQQMEASLPALIEAALQPLREDLRVVYDSMQTRFNDIDNRISKLEGTLENVTRQEAQDAPPEDISTAVTEARQTLDAIIPSLDGRSHKGQCGRIGILGGSMDFTGAPYYAGISALRTGAELLYLCTAAEAALPIKTYSPELMVTPVYSFDQIADQEMQDVEKQAFVDKVLDVVPRLHSLCLGPGLGRHEAVLGSVASIIEQSKKRDLPMVLDADALFLVIQNPEIVRGYRGAILTPNAMEYRLLAKACLGDETADLRLVCDSLQGVTVVQKGAVDQIFCSHEPGIHEPLRCEERGTPRRPGGIGDILAGVLATMLAWNAQRRGSKLRTCHAACLLVRRASRAAYAKNQRAMVAPDIIEELGPEMQKLCPA
eukprot:TRINITY_DN29349_c0_g1_i1.p1 TRINITY_DN29349_c0_g1~~TRINITY_DN29349_c0_g1_i1.p1  ORF type:complete len:407 (+),score=75.37 TRINITY_DN29349_c0_g1_i1:61-1281(+)